MKIAIASDASGFRLKEHVKQVLREAGHDVTDVGQQREDETVRYYEAGELLARAIQSGAYEARFCDVRKRRRRVHDGRQVSRRIRRGL